MAKDEKSGNEDYEFVPPSFDEDAFIHKELVSFRTTTILFVWGIVAALLSWGLFAAVDGAKVGWLIGLGVAVAFGFALKWVFPKMKADIKHFGRREWLGTAFLFFFTWLAFFLIAVNPPVSDFAAPRVDVLAAPVVQQSGGDVVLDAFFEDNVRVADHAYTVTGPNGPVATQDVDLGRGHHQIQASNLPPGLYEVKASATDGRDHVTEVVANFQVVDHIVDVVLPAGNAIDDPTDQVFVKLEGVAACTKKLREECVRSVELVRPTGDRIVLEHSEALGGWFATANFAGWTPGNVTFDVEADFINDYAGSVGVDGGRLESGPYSVTVSTTVGEYLAKGVRREPGPPARSVPDLGLPLLAVGLVAAVALGRRAAK